MFMGQRTKMAISPKWSRETTQFLSKSQLHFLQKKIAKELDRFILKFGGLRIAKTTSKNLKYPLSMKSSWNWRINSLNFKTYEQAIVIKTMALHKGKSISLPPISLSLSLLPSLKTEIPEIQPHTYGQLFFEKDADTSQ